jgi:hypothetical protein
MPWSSRRARLEIQWQRSNGVLSSQILQLREQLRIKESYAAGLETLLRQRNERIDQLAAQVDQLRQHSRHADEAAEHMAMFVGLMLNLDDAVAANQSMACITG